MSRAHRTIAAAVLAALLAVASAGCREEDAPLAPADEGYTHDYADALAVANAFCRAWQQGDYIAGRRDLHPLVIKKYPEGRIEDAIRGSGNPAHVAFELYDGKKIAEDQYAFHLRLLLRYEGQFEQRLEAPEGRIVVIRDPSGAWRVAEFPLLP